MPEGLIRRGPVRTTPGCTTDKREKKKRGKADATHDRKLVHAAMSESAPRRLRVRPTNGEAVEATAGIHNQGIQLFSFLSQNDVFCWYIGVSGMYDVVFFQ